MMNREQEKNAITKNRKKIFFSMPSRWIHHGDVCRNGLSHMGDEKDANDGKISNKLSALALCQHNHGRSCSSTSVFWGFFLFLFLIT
jgi:hypothetical protein